MQPLPRDRSCPTLPDAVTRAHDIIVIGAGIVGAACALALRREGLDVGLVDAAPPGSGITAVGMGHVVALDENAAELALCQLSQQLWNRFYEDHPGIGEPSRCGTLWVAEDEHQLHEAQQRAQRLAADMVSGDRLRQLEPALRPGLAGGVLVRGDSVVYPPAVASFLASQLADAGGALYIGQRVTAIGEREITLTNGQRMRAGGIVAAAGPGVAALVPGVPVFGRKGHLAITDRYPGTLTHQVVSMNYGQPSGGADALAVAANVQPRTTGQWLVGSCRQDRQQDNSIDPAVLGAVLRSAIALLPCLAQMTILRAWAGMRPATPDGLPLIGAHPARPGVWLACGHEGLGVTTAFGTARLLADQVMGRPCSIDASPYAPARFDLIRSASHGR
ncbi:MAG: FAD-dependent oxidoreductase [Pseudomonadota bacterium]